MLLRDRVIWLFLAVVCCSIQVQAFQFSVIRHDSTSFQGLYSHQQDSMESSEYLSVTPILSADTEAKSLACLEPTCWAQRGLLLSSSLSSTLNKSKQAKLFLISSLLLSMASQYGQPVKEQSERKLHHSSLLDPHYIHDEITQLTTFISQLKTQIYIRILYIPTAMYALQSDSSSTPGKQRQRARADGKKRRDAIVEYIQQLKLLGNEDVQILAITLDLDDGSLKQPDGSNDPQMFPQSGHEAFLQWNPNLIYLEGGNTFWLYHCIQKGNWMHDIHQACSRGNESSTDPSPMGRFAVFVGKSAGAIVAGNKIETACWKGWDDPFVVPGMSTREDWKLVSGMKMAGEASSFFPHMSSEWEHVVDMNTQDWDDSQVKNLFLLHDDDAVLVDGRHNFVTLASQDP